MDMQKAAFAIAGLATAYSVFSSVRLIRSHLANWTKPQQQKHIVAIIAMVPLFAVDSFIGLLDMDASESFVMFLDAIKECYEAFVLMSFLQLMFEYLNVGWLNVPEELKGKLIHHTPPFSWFMKDFPLDAAAVKMLYQWTLQFMVLRPVLSVISLWLDINDAYEAWATPIGVVLNISVTVAVTALLTFFHAFEHELSPHRPLAQFLCIKGVVFFAFWQGVVLSVLVRFGIVHGSHWYTTEEIDDGIQNFLVCVEMGALFSFAHDYAFAATEFKPGYVAPPLPPKKDDGHAHGHAKAH